MRSPGSDGERADMDTRDRLIKLEVEVVHLREKLDEAGRKVTEMHTLLMESRGAWKFMLAAAGLASGATALAIKVLPWLGGAPR